MGRTERPAQLIRNRRPASASSAANQFLQFCSYQYACSAARCWKPSAHRKVTRNHDSSDGEKETSYQKTRDVNEWRRAASHGGRPDGARHVSTYHPGYNLITSQLGFVLAEPELKAFQAIPGIYDSASRLGSREVVYSNFPMCKPGILRFGWTGGGWSERKRRVKQHCFGPVASFEKLSIMQRPPKGET